MNSVQDDRSLHRPGFPIRKSTDQSSLSSSPWLIAADHVLHRLLAPRHPPSALCSLTKKFVSSSRAADVRRLLPRHYFRLDPEIYSIVKDRHLRLVWSRAPGKGARRRSRSGTMVEL